MDPFVTMLDVICTHHCSGSCRNLWRLFRTWRGWLRSL